MTEKLTQLWRNVGNEFASIRTCRKFFEVWR